VSRAGSDARRAGFRTSLASRSRFCWQPLVIVWAISGPFFGFSDTWQLVINTSTTIITFLMVFLIQNTQNRDTAAMQIKLAELIIRLEGADDKLATAEDLSDKDLERLHREYKQRAEETLASLHQRRGKAA
jgi:low affinity Fe/Cu permease